MKMPVLYDSTESSFEFNGIGVLSDAITCKVTEERNGAYELNMQYPISGIHFEEIAIKNIILAKPNPNTEPQPFRIFRITKPINGIVSIYAEHISYDLSGVPIQPFVSSSIQEAFTKLKINSVVEHPFTFYTDKETTAKMTVPSPCSLRSQLGGKSGSILDVYGGGEYEFDRYRVNLYQHRGMNHGVSIRYGKNLISLEQEQNCSNIYSGVYPFWINSENGDVIQLDEKIVPVNGTFNFVKILTLDLSSEWQNQPTKNQIKERTIKYIAANDIGIPTVNLKVSFAQLEQSDEYKGLALLDRVSLCDTVNVYFDKLGVNATAKAIKIIYDVLLNRIESIELGDSRTKITDTVLAQQEANEDIIDRNDVSAMINQLTAEILGANGGAVRMLDENEDGIPDTLYIADDPDPAKAVKVWRFNYLGWGASSKGYNGPFTLGATLEKGIIADFITAGVLNAQLIQAGLLQDKGGKNKWNLDTGEFTVSSGAKIGNDTILNLINSAKEDAIDTSASALENAVIGITSDLSVIDERITATVTEASRIEGLVSVNKSSIEELGGQISQKVSQSTYENDMANKADTSFVESTVESIQIQTAEAIENRFTQSKKYTDTAVDEYKQLKEDVYAWQKFSADGLEIGKSDSPFKTRLTNNRLSFLENNTEVAYIGDSALNITNARVRQIFSVGTESDGWFDWAMGNDGLTMKWKG